MTFHVGQKVVCINDTPWNSPLLGTLRRGCIYTIRWIGIHLGQPCVKVDEILRPCGLDISPDDTPFLSRRFRPLIERKTDISIFTAMLNPSKRSVDA